MQGIELFYREYGNSKAPALIILHGLFGMSDNWATMAKALSNNHHVIVPDLRNHGNSPHTEEFSYEAMTADLLLLYQKLGIDRADLLGHSMGGKLVIHFALEHPTKVNRPVVADMSMKEGEFKEMHALIMNTIARTDLKQFKTYAEIQQALEKFIPKKRIVLFAMKNIRKNADGSFGYKLNYMSIYNHSHRIMEPVVTDAVFSRPALFIRGSESDYILDEDFEEIKKNFPKAQLLTIEKAGHWLHADRPELFLKAVEDFLNNGKQKQQDFRP